MAVADPDPWSSLATELDRLADGQDDDKWNDAQLETLYSFCVSSSVWKRLVSSAQRTLDAATVGALRRPDAEDVVGDRLANLFAHRKHPKHDGLKSWIYACIRNAALSHVRHERREPSSPLSRACSNFEETNTRDIVTLPRRICPPDVRDALNRLGDRDRTLLTMYHLDGATDPEVSAATGIPTGNVRKYRKRAGEKLRRLLGPKPE
jgi:RNA polymerase sigma factor (sigma-70 family)